MVLLKKESTTFACVCQATGYFKSSGLSCKLTCLDSFNTVNKAIGIINFAKPFLNFIDDTIF